MREHQRFDQDRLSILLSESTISGRRTKSCGAQERRRAAWLFVLHRHGPAAPASAPRASRDAERLAARVVRALHEARLLPQGSGIAAGARAPVRLSSGRDVPPVFSAAREAVELMGEARELGLVDGFCVPLYGITGWQAGLSFGTDPRRRPRPQAASPPCTSSPFRLTDGMRALHGEPELSGAKARRRASARCSPGWRPERRPGRTSCILHVAEKTVRAHLESIRQKLNVASITQAVACALRTGELQPY